MKLLLQYIPVLKLFHDMIVKKNQKVRGLAEENDEILERRHIILGLFSCCLLVEDLEVPSLQK